MPAAPRAARVFVKNFTSGREAAELARNAVGGDDEGVGTFAG